MNKNYNQLKIGSFLSYFQMLIGVVIGLLYTPIMLRLLGSSEYGLYNTVSSTISMLSLLSLGFNSGYIRYYTIYKQKKDYDSIWKLNGLFLCIFSIIGVIAFLCGTFLTMHLEYVFDRGLTSSEYKTAEILMMLLTINLSISFPMSVFSNIISANEKFVFLKLLSILKTVVSPLVTLPLLLMGHKSIAMVSVTIIIALITDVIFLVYVFKVLKHRFVFRGFEKEIFFSLLAYTSFIAINMVIDQINWNVDKILLGRFKGTEAVAVYSVGYTLYQYYMMFSTSISSVFTPRIHKIVNETKDDLLLQKKLLTDLFVKVGRIQFILLGLVASGLVFFGKSFITNFWAGSEYENSYYVTLLLALPATIALIQNIGIEIQRAQNRHQFRSIVYFCMAIINIAISVVLCQKYGAIGSAIGTAISLLIANGLIINIYYHKRCNINIIEFWSSILRLCRGLVIPCILGIVIYQTVQLNTLISFCLSILLYTLVYCISLWLGGMNQYEKDLLIRPIHRIMRKINDRKK